MQIPYLSEFFGTHWYLVRKDTYEMYAIYDALFSEIPYSTQLTPFDLVALDTDLQEHLADRSSHINTGQDWVTQISDSYSKWIKAAAVSKHFPQSMLSVNDRHQIHLDFVTATGFVGKTYRAYEGLIMADPANCHAHLANHDRDLERVRKCFRHIETFAISDNHYRSVSGLPPAPYPEHQPSQAALEQNSPEYLTSLANFEVGSILRVMEQPEMYADYVDVSTTSTPTASKTTGSQHGTPILQAQSSKTIDRSNSNKLVWETLSTVQKENNPAVRFRPIHRPPSMSRSLLSPEVTHS